MGRAFGSISVSAMWWRAAGRAITPGSMAPPTRSSCGAISDPMVLERDRFIWKQICFRCDSV